MSYLFLADAYPESLPARAAHSDCAEAEATIDRLMAELVQTTVQREEALELANQAAARIDVVVMQHDESARLLGLALKDIAELSALLVDRTLERDAARAALRMARGGK